MNVNGLHIYAFLWLAWPTLRCSVLDVAAFFEYKSRACGIWWVANSKWSTRRSSCENIRRYYTILSHLYFRSKAILSLVEYNGDCPFESSGPFGVVPRRDQCWMQTMVLKAEIINLFSIINAGAELLHVVRCKFGGQCVNLHPTGLVWRRGRINSPQRIWIK